MRIEFLMALEDSTWTTKTVDVPDSISRDDTALVDWAQQHLAPQAQYRDVVLFAVYNNDPEERDIEAEDNARRRAYAR